MSHWLKVYRETAQRTDMLKGHPSHLELLGVGLFGEAGSILAELKKEKREKQAYRASTEKMLEEYGDFVWYFVRLVDLLAPDFFDTIPSLQETAAGKLTRQAELDALMALGSTCGEIVHHLRTGHQKQVPRLLQQIWSSLPLLTHFSGLTLPEIVRHNEAKINSRWPEHKVYHALFDSDCPEEEQLPRKLTVSFHDRKNKGKNVVLLRCNGINFGDRLSDNITAGDDYRFHDIFHFAYAAHLGWSPVIRALLRTKRKSKPEADEAQDGARAIIIEEAVSATVFSRAKDPDIDYFHRLHHVDYDLLKTIRGFVKGYEVDAVPLWQWEHAILDGFRIFRLLKEHGGGTVTLNVNEHNRSLRYHKPRHP